ncbi:GAF domain-containing protein [Rhodococcus pyridinivorans]|uniref:sensor histidine kinase n=1 Tax=Rhodococcus pyridinivorans TaxID=103816 RepID=UPI00216408EC|nr:GAF domain-containing protein [Rhodococcus pyridinivorans]UVT26692.1 GAF domain-containing protein [Rhodococcus pyridinivorans]
MIEPTDVAIDTLLAELRDRLDDSVDAPTTLRGLLEAVLVVGSGLELDSMLQRIVSAATALLDARYGALGVRAADGGLSEFVYVGINPTQREVMGHLPEGRGILGLLINDPRPVRLGDLSKHSASIGFPPNHPPMKSFLGTPIMVRGKVFGSIYLTEKLGAPEFTEEDEVILKVLAMSAGVAVENARLFEGSLDRERWLTAMASINSRLLMGGSVDETLSMLTGQVRELARCAGAYVMLVDGHHGRLQAASPAAPCGKDKRFDLTGSPVLNALKSRQPMHLDTLEGLPPMKQGDEGHAVVLPLSATSTVTGVLVATREAGTEPWDDEDVARFESMANLAAVALEFAEQQRKKRLLDVLADRDRIAQDLHDNVIQRLFATGMSLQSATADGANNERIVEVIRHAIEQLDRTVREIRTTIFDLHTTGAAASNSLRRRLLDVVGDLSIHSSVAPNVQFVGPIDTLVPMRIHPHAEAVLREGLSNALRHSQSDNISVSVSVQDDFRIEILDDGTGLPDMPRRSGLANLERRAVQCGGSCEIGPAHPRGTRVLWAVPL